MLAVVSQSEFGGVLAALERDVAAAQRGADNAITVGDTALRVDQVRRIASIPGNPESWIERDGRKLVRNDTRLGRLTLAYVVGRRRYLTAEDFVHVLGHVLRPRPATPAAEVAQFTNLVVVEPEQDPERELAIWLAVAHKLASGRERDYLARELPDLTTDHDPLYAEIPEGAPYADLLAPDASRPAAPALADYTRRLLAATSADDPEGYIREHVLARSASPSDA